MHIAQSAFLQVLGFAIMNSLWQFALLWLVYISLCTFFRLSSGQKYATGLALHFSGFIWFVITLVSNFGNPTVTASYTSGSRDSLFNLANTASVNQKVYDALQLFKQLLPYLSLIYLLILCVLLVKMVRSYRQTQLIRKSRLAKADVEWRLFVRKFALQLGIKERVGVYLSAIVQSPLTIGFFKPVILLPLACINRLSPEQIEAVLLHELAHIKRNDYLINLLVLITEMCLFFNPFMQLISKNIKKERENICDDWVLQYQYNSASYAKALLAIASWQIPVERSFAVNAMDNNKTLLGRVKRVLKNNQAKSPDYNKWMLPLFLFAFVGTIVFFTSAKTYLRSFSRSNTPENEVVTKPLEVFASQSLYNPVYLKIVVEKSSQSKVQNAVRRIKSITEKHVSNTGLTADLPEEESTTSTVLASAPEIRQKIVENDRGGEDYGVDFATNRINLPTEAELQYNHLNNEAFLEDLVYFFELFKAEKQKNLSNLSAERLQKIDSFYRASILEFRQMLLKQYDEVYRHNYSEGKLRKNMQSEHDSSNTKGAYLTLFSFPENEPAFDFLSLDVNSASDLPGVIILPSAENSNFFKTSIKAFLNDTRKEIMKNRQQTGCENIQAIPPQPSLLPPFPAIKRFRVVRI